MKKKKIIIVFVIILVIVIGAIFIINGKNDNNTSNKNAENENSSKTTSTESELNEFAEYLNQKENNGFILSNYTTANDIDLLYVFAIDKYEVKDNEDIKKYEKLTGSKVTSTLYKVSTKEIKDVIREKTGLDTENYKIKGDNFKYSSEDDSYYFLNSDNLYTKVKCTNWSQNNDIYEVEYEAVEKNGNDIKGTLTLMKQEETNRLLFLANKLLDKISTY